MLCVEIRLKMGRYRSRGELLVGAMEAGFTPMILATAPDLCGPGPSAGIAETYCFSLAVSRS